MRLPEIPARVVSFFALVEPGAFPPTTLPVAVFKGGRGVALIGPVEGVFPEQAASPAAARAAHKKVPMVFMCLLPFRVD
jgi:hypothetical protein